MLIGKIKCELCGESYKTITHSHLMKNHGITLKEYILQFPEAPLFNQSVEEQKLSGKELLIDALERNWR